MNSLSINTTEEWRWAAGTHVASLILAFLTSWAAGLAGMLGAAAVLLLKPANGSPFVEQHAKGPAVEDGMVRFQRQQMLLGVQLEQLGGKERPLA